MHIEAFTTKKLGMCVNLLKMRVSFACLAKNTEASTQREPAAHNCMDVSAQVNLDETSKCCNQLIRALVTAIHQKLADARSLDLVLGREIALALDSLLHSNHWCRGTATFYCDSTAENHSNH